MRRKDKEQNSKEFMHAVLDNAETIFLAMFDGDFPYCLPLNFVRQNENLYLHCANAGLKLDCIVRNNRVAFSAAIDIKIDTDKASTYYKSVCGQGLARIVEDIEEKRLALDLLASRYKARCVVPAPLASITRTTIIKIEILNLTGKASLPK